MSGTALSDDLLDGVDDFVRFLGADKFNRRRVFYLIGQGHLPAGKIGRRIIGSKTAVLRKLAEITGSGAA